MPYDLLVEISEDLDPAFRERLLSLAYRASRSREVALVLRGISPSDVDRTLDPVVEREGTGVAGVRYLDPEEALPLLRANGGSECVVLSRNPGWLADAGAGPLSVRSPEEGVALLEEGLAANGAA